MEQIDLSGLRDIHLPLEPSWWPPAMGWWILTGIAILAILIAGFMFYVWYNSPCQYALRELKTLFREAPNSVWAARRLSVLLKRIVLLLYPRSPVATLTDEAWITFLTDKTKSAFNEEQLNLLAMAPYMPENAVPPIDAKAFYSAAQKAIITLFERKKHGNKSAKHP